MFQETTVTGNLSLWPKYNRPRGDEHGAEDDHNQKADRDQSWVLEAKDVRRPVFRAMEIEGHPEEFRSY